MATKRRTTSRPRTKPAGRTAPRAAAPPKPQAKPEPKPIPSWLGPAILGVVVLFVVWQVRPNLIFANTTPTGQDLGGHVWAPAFLRDHLLPHLSGWSPDMFGGVATYVLYPVLPALVVVILGGLVPYGVALKLVVAAGLVLMPVAAYVLGKLAKLAVPVPACFAIGTLPFLFDSSYHAFGGNLLSTVSGEFSYSLGLVALVVSLALIEVVSRTGRWRALAAVTCAVCALCHPVTALLLAVAAAILVGVHVWLEGKEALARVWPVGAVAVLLSLFWFLPFAVYRHELTNTVNPRQTNWATLFFPLPPLWELVVGGLMVFGAYSAFKRREAIPIALAGLTLAAALGVLVLPAGVLVNVRVVPLWHLWRMLVAAYGAAEAVRIVPRYGTQILVGGLVVVVVVLGINLGSLPGTTVSRVQTANGPVQHSRWLMLPSVSTSLDPVLVSYGFGGYERYFHADEYKALVATMEQIGARDGCGRAFDEFDPTARYGSIYALTILPYWTGGCIDGMSGVAPDQSRNTPFIEAAQQALSDYVDLPTGQGRTIGLNVALGVSMLRDLGVRYYLTWSPPAQHQAAIAPGLTQIATSGQWKIYEVAQVQTVEPLTAEPVPTSGAEGPWDRAALSWMTAPAPRPPQPVSGGSWGPAVPAVPQITDLKVGTDRVRFHVDVTGTPVLVRVDDFPWWHASGAEGPWRAAPDNMVVVPTAHDVVLTAAPRGADHAGEAFSILGLLALLGLAGWDLTRRRRGAAAS